MCLYLARSALLKNECFITAGSRVAPHLSRRGTSILGNIIRASWSPLSADSTSGCVLPAVSLDGPPSELVLLVWNWASGMENAKLGS